MQHNTYLFLNRTRLKSIREQNPKGLKFNSVKFDNRGLGVPVKIQN